MADMKAIYGDDYHKYWVGGRFEGGLSDMPHPDEVFTDPGFGNHREITQSRMALYNGDPRYFGYEKGVFIDPNYDLSSLTPEERLNLPDEAYIVNGEDPYKTLYLNPYRMEGNILWYGSQFRVHDATSFKVKEINLTYSFDRSLAQRLNAQNIHITAFAKNAMFWAKNSMNEDPETAFRDGLRGFGVPEFTLPPIRSMGVKLALDFYIMIIPTNKNIMMIKNIIGYIALGVLLSVSIGCTDQLRLDERQTTFDEKYFTYSRYQLTTAIVNVFKNYGRAAMNEPVGQAALYFMDCYASDRIALMYTTPEQNWNMEDTNPYTSELRTLAAIKKLATDEGNMATVAAADILKSVVGAYLTEKYGDIPFSEAVDGREGNLFPKYDTQKEVYERIFSLLDGAIATLSDPSSEGLPADHDVLFNGDKSKWIKFANSLKFRLMVHSYEAFKREGKDLSSEMQAIASGGNYMKEVNDNASLTFSGNNENEAWYLQTKWGTPNDFTEQKPTKYLIDLMVDLDDPRMYVIFAPVLSPVSAKSEETTETIRINGFDYDITYYPASQYEAPQLVAT